MNRLIEITWLGHACFRLVFEHYAVVIDPYQDGAVPGLPPLRTTAQQVLYSHCHGRHKNTEAVTIQEKRPSPFLMTQIASTHDNEGGALWGLNTIHLLEAGGLRVAHLGDVGAPPTPYQLEGLGHPDAVMIPVGGHKTIGAQEAMEWVRALAPRVVIPMHYRTEEAGCEALATPEDFLALCDKVVYYEGNTIELTPATKKQTAVLKVIQ